MPTKLNPTPLVKPWLMLTLVALIALVGIILNQEATKPITPATINTNQTTNWKRVTNSNALFFSKIFLDRSKTFVYIPIKFETDPQIAWLSLNSTPSAQPQSFLMTHPALTKLNWSSLDRGTVHLYQRRKTYNSMADFVAHPPTNRVGVEKDIQQLDYYRHITGVPLDQNFSLDQVDYLLTTYTQPKQKNGVFDYENTIDATNGYVNQNENLTWQIFVPTASETNPFYLGGIHIDYRR